mmetsp:Transcript_114790/g.225214  ORF Transcript_114790/g.225214 Transcript_114790/m.225214 type:complete len:241 (-) Transcript_114790:170-892(-)
MDPDMPQIVLGLVPAVMVAPGLEDVGPGGLELLAERLLHLLAEEVRPVILDAVLQACVLAVRAVAKVPLHGHDRLGDVLRVLRQAEADDVRQPRVRLLIVVREAEAAADGDVEALQLVVLDDRNEAAAVSEDVHVVARRDGNRDLELPRQVRLPVERLLLEGRRSEDLRFLGHLLTMHEEDLVVGTGPRQTVVMDRVSVVDNLLHDLPAASGWVGGAHDVAADVAARSQGVHARSVDGAH